MQDQAHNTDDAERTAIPPVSFDTIEVEEEPAEETPKPLPLPYRKRVPASSLEPSSRELMLGWCIWLLTSWVMLGMGLDGRPLRAMVIASSLGMMLIWPVFRLSQHGRKERINRVPDVADENTSQSEVEAASPNQTSAKSADHSRSLLTPALIFRDWFALNSVFQAILWPNVLSEQWTWDQAAWVSVSVAAWSLLVAAIVAWGCLREGSLRRSGAMLIILLLMFGEPLALSLIHQFAQQAGTSVYDWQLHISPLGALYALADRPILFDSESWRFPVISISIVATLSWWMVMALEKTQLPRQE